MNIGIIGIGNMGGAIASAFMENIAHERVWLCDINDELIAQFRSKSDKVNIVSSTELAKNCDIIIVAVKPWLVKSVVEAISSVTEYDDKLIVSIAAGVETDTIKNMFKGQVAIARVMPNIAIAADESMTFISTKYCTAEQEKNLLELFGMSGKAMMIKEELMGSATSLASCGIAYALRFIRASMVGGIELGFNAQTSQEIVLQTLKGAVALLELNDTHPEVEIDKVCTPGGWTIKGLNEMEANGFTNAVIKGLKANQ